MKTLFSLVIVVVLIALVAWISKSPSGSDKVKSTSQPSQLVKEDIIVGQGKEVAAGNTVKVHYVGTLENGIKFDSSVDRGQPFEFTPGVSEVIKGWDEGVVGMKVGGKRKLTIPADLGYGNRVTGTIPANSTLIFEIDLLEIVNAG